MRYAIAIEPGDEAHAFGVTVPDLPGCFSAGDTLGEAVEQVRVAITLHIEGLLDDGEPMPTPRTLAALQPLSEYAGRPATAERVRGPGVGCARAGVGAACYARHGLASRR